MSLKKWFYLRFTKLLLKGSLIFGGLLVGAVTFVAYQLERNNLNLVRQLLVNSLDRPIRLSNYYEINKICSTFFDVEGISQIKVESNTGAVLCDFNNSASFFNSNIEMPIDSSWPVHKIVVLSSFDHFVYLILMLIILITVATYIIHKIAKRKVEVIGTDFCDPIIETVDSLRTFSETPTAGFIPRADSGILEIELINRKIREFAIKSFELAQIRLEREISASKVQLARRVGHDVRSPLTALNTLAKRQPFESTKHQELFLKAIDRIEGIARDLLNLDKTSDAVVTPVQNAINLHEVLLAIISEKKIEWPDADIVYIPADAAHLSCAIDKTEIGRIISNLINNSIESYCEKTPKVTVKISRHEQYAVLRISDLGCGISASILEKIAEGEPISDRQDRSGHGIGLSSAIETVRRCNGRLEIDTLEGQGTTMSVFLPTEDSNPRLV